MKHTNLTAANRPMQPAVEQPPPEADLWRSIALYLRLRAERPDIFPGAAWDLARSSTWRHWREAAA